MEPRIAGAEGRSVGGGDAKRGGGVRRGVIKPRTLTPDILAKEANLRHKVGNHPPTELSPVRTSTDWEMCDHESCVAFRAAIDRLHEGLPAAHTGWEF